MSAIWLLAYCKHPRQDTGYIGPENAPAPKGFYVVSNLFQPAVPSIDLNDRKQSFMSSFSARVQWYITISGQTSGAEKKLSGTSSTLTSDQVSWDGASDNAIFFQTGETCLVTLTFLESDIVLRTNFAILKVKNGKNILIDDFETGNANTKIKMDSVFEDAGDVGIVIDRKDSLTVFQGKYSLLLKGKDQNSNYWVAGIMNSGSALLNKVGLASADSLLVNLFVFGRGKGGTSLEIKLMEDDDASHTYDINKDDAYHAVIAVDWQGWKSISLPYRSFSNIASDGKGKGNNRMEAGHIIKLDLTVISVPQGQDTEVNIDYISLTGKE